MSTGANATPNGTHKVHKKVEDNGKGKDDGNKNAIVVVAGVVVASGIAFSLYKTFHKEDHPLVNTERGIKQDASNALDGTREKSWEFKSSAERKARDAQGNLEGAGRGIKGTLADAGSSVKHGIEGAGERVKDTFEGAGDRVKGAFDRGDQEVEQKSWEAKKELDNKGREVESKGWGAKREVENRGWGAKNELENKSRDAKYGLENTGKDVEKKSRGFFGSVENKAKDAKGEAEEKGRDIRSGLKEAGRDVKSFANREKEKVQDAGSHFYEQGKEAKKRIDGREIRVHKGDTLWGLSRRYGVSVESLKASNGILAGDYIAAGDTITIPY